MKRSKSSRLSITGFAVVALLSTAIIPTGAFAASSEIGSVNFASNSSSLTPAAKRTLSGLKSKIVTSDKLTATGYIRNHSNNGHTVALARANAVKNYLVSIGVKATIGVADGGVPKVGGSTASANKVTIIKTVSNVASSNYTVTAGMSSVASPSKLSESFCTGATVKAELKPTKGGTTYSKTAKGTWDGFFKSCYFSATVTGTFTGTYKAKITITDPSNAKILKYFLPSANQTNGLTPNDWSRTSPNDDTVVIELKNPVTPLAGFGGSAINHAVSLLLNDD